MKKRILIMLAFIVSMVTMITSVFAITTQFRITRNITDAFDEKGWTYTVKGLTDDEEDEQIKITFDGDYKDTIDINLFAKENDSTERVQMFCWDVIEYKESEYYDVLETVNELNRKYIYTKFFCDTSDNTVTAEFDGYTPTRVAGEITVKMVSSFQSIIDNAYTQLRVYDISR